MAFRLELRAFRGEVHQAAGNALAVKRRRGAFDDIHTLNKPRVYLQNAVAAAVAHQAHAVEENIVHIAAMEAAQGNGVEARCAAADIRKDPWRIVQRFGKRTGALVFHLLAGDDGNRLAGGYQRLIGFGRAAGGFHRVALSG